MRLESIANFITPEEADELNRFTIGAILSKKFVDGKTSKYLNANGLHMVSRFTPSIEFPELALQLQNKVCKILNLGPEHIHRMFHPTGIVVNCTYKGGKLLEHTDPKDPDKPTKSLLRCNLLSSASLAGGDLMVEGTKVDVPELSVYFCLVSDHIHSITTVEGNKPRIVWQFGFDVDAEDWNSGKIKVQQ